MYIHTNGCTYHAFLVLFGCNTPRLCGLSKVVDPQGDAAEGEGGSIGDMCAHKDLSKTFTKMRIIDICSV